MKTKVFLGKKNFKKIKIYPTLSFHFIDIPQCVRVKLAKKYITNLKDFLKLKKEILFKKIKNFKKEHQKLIKQIREDLLRSLKHIQLSKKELYRINSKLLLLKLLKKFLYFSPESTYELLQR